MTAAVLTFDASALAKEMYDAARKAVARRGSALRIMTELEMRRLAGALADIGSMLATGEIDPDRARALAAIHQLSVRSVLRAVEGLGVLATNEAIEAITRVAANTLNRIVGFKLL